MPKARTTWIVLPALLTWILTLGLSLSAFAETHDVIVVGGGVAGLSAAWHLKDLDLVVLEKGAQVGGRMAGGVYRGWHYAMGAEYIGLPEGTMQRLVRASGAKLVEIPSPMDARVNGGKFYWGDDGLGLLLSSGSSLSAYNRFGKTLQTLAGHFDDGHGSSRAQERLDGITAGAWFKENGFGEIYRDVYNVASRGLFGASLDDVSALSVIPEFGFDFEGFTAEKQPFDEQDNRPNRKERSGAYTFEGGMAAFAQGLAAQLGDRVHTDTEAINVSRLGDDFEVTTRNARGETRVWRARALVMAVPAPVALALAGPLLGKEERAIVRGIPYSTYATVALMSDKPIFDKAFDLAVPDGKFFTDIYDCTWVQRHLDHPGGDPGVGILGIYIAPPRCSDRSLLELSDAGILLRVRADLEAILPGCWSLVKKTEIKRFPCAYPVMTPGAYRRLARLNSLMVSHPLPLQLAGDYLAYPTLEAAAESGSQAAARIRKAMNKRRDKQ